MIYSILTQHRQRQQREMENCVVNFATRRSYAMPELLLQVFRTPRT